MRYWSSRWSTSASRLKQVPRRTSSYAANAASSWRPASALDDYVVREARPVSLRQLTFFGRSLNESRLLSSANYVRTELPTRLSHRIRDMQTLPYVVVTNSHMSHVYELYYKAFEALRRVPEIKTIEDNDRYCKIISDTLREHLTVIPRLAMGVLECRDLIPSGELDLFMTTLLRSRISRRVIAQQHLALTETFHSPWHFPDAKSSTDNGGYVGEVFLKCSAREVVEKCAEAAQEVVRQAYGGDVTMPQVKIEGHLDATFPYILGHLEYIIGELLRNSVQAVMDRYKPLGDATPPPPIEVLICEAPQHVIIRISDRGGGIPREILPHLWSFNKGPRSEARLNNLSKVPLTPTSAEQIKKHELEVPDRLTSNQSADAESTTAAKDTSINNFQTAASLDPSDTPYAFSSLSSVTNRPPNLRLGMGLPMSKVYAEYWAGSLEIHSLEGYGVDAFLQISKLGNKNEQLVTRASMDAI
ncbi:MAG: hypothetical protein M4579_003066 [Chaenotheca gracillima]|nr:MAG: hypothetical protein M4579_003066 [Chaenotheca gracillima]